jgi:hypothetical protein
MKTPVIAYEQRIALKEQFNHQFHSLTLHSIAEHSSSSYTYSLSENDTQEPRAKPGSQLTCELCFRVANSNREVSMSSGIGAWVAWLVAGTQPPLLPGTQPLALAKVSGRRASSELMVHPLASKTH